MVRRMRWSGWTRTRSSGASWPSRSTTAKATRAGTSVVLEAFEITEISEVASVLLEAGVYDRKGRFVSGLTSANFAVQEDGVAQAIDLVSHERVPATFALLIDSSQSMSRRFDFVKEAAGRLTAFLRPQDSVVVAPFAKRLQAADRPHRRSAHHHRGHPAHRAHRRHGHPRFAHRAQRTAAQSRGSPFGHPHQRWLRRAQPRVVRAGARRRQERRDHDLCRRHRRHRRHLAQGRARAEAAGQRDRRPRLLSAPRPRSSPASTTSSRPTRRIATW